MFGKVGKGLLGFHISSWGYEMWQKYIITRCPCGCRVVTGLFEPQNGTPKRRIDKILKTAWNTACWEKLPLYVRRAIKADIRKNGIKVAIKRFSAFNAKLIS